MNFSFVQRGFLLAAATAVLASGATASAADMRLTINGGQTKGTFNRVASGWAVYITKNIGGVNASSKASAGSLDDTRQVDAGKADLGLGFATDLHDAAKGIGSFKKAASNVSYMAFLFGSVGHFVVPDSSSIKKLSDIKQDHFHGGPESGSAKNLIKLIKHVGL